jgi:L-ascorbate metabolism protein UlaG (beta-lactamase superfamily)
MQGTVVLLPLILLAPFFPSPTAAQEPVQEDVIPTSSGDLTIRFIGHGTLMFRHNGKVIHVDPVEQEADYSALPDADLILVTHEHGDHLDPEAIEEITRASTSIVASRSCEERLAGAWIMGNGDTATAAGYRIEAVPSYNIQHVRAEGQPYHPRGSGNGYIITFGDTRVYVAGDTENTPEMKALRDIDVAFLPMNLPYTMTPEMVADAARAFRPRILYPYHFGDTDTGELVRLMAGEAGIEVRVRSNMR